MTADRAVFLSCMALWAVAMLVVTDQMGAGAISQATVMPAEAKAGGQRKSNVPVPTAPTNSLTTSDLAALFSRCVTSALNDDHSPAFISTDPHTERRMEIYCDAVPELKVVSYERRDQ